MKNVQLPLFLRTMDRKKLTMYGIVVAVAALLIATVWLSMTLSGGSSSSPIVTTKLRAALLTYKRTVIIVGANATPTPIGNGGLPTINPTNPAGSRVTPPSGTGTRGGNNAGTEETGTPTMTPNQSTTPTATPEEEVIFDNMSPTQADSQEVANTDSTPTPTDEEIIADGSVTDTVSPTNTQKLPETGSIQYPIILFISASVFLFISFLF